MENINQFNGKHECSFNLFDQNSLHKMNNKVDQIFSLASVYNSRNLEINSQIILNLTRCTESLHALNEQSCESLKNILNGIIYEEWFELYEYQQCKKNNQTFNFTENQLFDILDRRLNSRKLAQEAFLNILSLNMDTKIEGFYKNILFISKFNESLIKNFKIDLELVKQNLTELNDEKSYQLIIELGGLYAISELIELLWNLDHEVYSIEISSLCLNILNNFLKVASNWKTIRRSFLTSLKKCLNQNELILPTTILINNLSKVTLFNQIELTDLYSNILASKVTTLEPKALKTVLVMLNNLSLSYPNKPQVYTKLSIDVLVFLFKNFDDKILDLSLKLVKSVSNEFGQEYSYEIFKILSDVFLKCPNISLVRTACEILWLLSSKLDKSKHQDLINFDVDAKLKCLINSTDGLISSSCLAILRNLYSSGDYLDETGLDFITSPSRLSMTSSIHSTTSSSSSSIMLPSRHKKQVIEDENELLKKLNNSSDSFESISSTGSSSSNDTYYLNESDESVNEIQEKVFQIHFEQIKCKSIIKNDQNRQPTKHVTFNMDFNDEIYIEIDSSNEKLKNQRPLIDLNYKPASESLVYLNFLNRSRRYQEKSQQNKCESRSVSPVKDFKFIKSTSKLNVLNENKDKLVDKYLDTTRQIMNSSLVETSTKENDENKLIKNIQANTKKLVGLVRPLKA